jgi:hypothetical protein
MDILKKVWCDCVRCIAWDGRTSCRKTCDQIECACEDKVSLVRWKNGDVMCARYVCPDKLWPGDDEAFGGYFCGFNVDAFDDCHKYVTIMQSVAEYIFYMLYRDKCRCNKQTKAILMRVSCGDNATTCTHADTVHDNIRYTRTTGIRRVRLQEELQLFYVCPDDACGYKLSVVEIVRRRYSIKCLCGRVCLYEEGVYSCGKLNGGCGVLFHEKDSLTFMHTWIRNKQKPLSLYPPRICHQKACIKYIFNEVSMRGQLLYRCRVDGNCLLVKDMDLNDCTIA